MSAATDIQHPAVIGQVMVNFGARYGVDAESCLMDTGITPAQLSDPETLIAREQEMRLVENLMLALPDVPALGFELGLQYNIATFGIWGFALRISRTLHEACEFALRYIPLSTAYCRLSLFSDATLFGVAADPEPIPLHLQAFLLERDMGTAVNLLHELGLSGVRARQLCFRGPAPAYAARIAELSGLQPQYHCDRNAIVLQRADAERPLPMYDPHLVRLLEDQCRAQLAHRQPAGITGQVRQLLLGPLGLIASLEDVAQHMALAPRSLRRRLEAEGTRFRDLVEAERRQLAARLLESTDMKLDELALHLGYGDTASFNRAFRRWFAQAPGEYRRRNQAAG